MTVNRERNLSSRWSLRDTKAKTARLRREKMVKARPMERKPARRRERLAYMFFPI